MAAPKNNFPGIFLLWAVVALAALLLLWSRYEAQGLKQQWQQSDRTLAAMEGQLYTLKQAMAQKEALLGAYRDTSMRAIPVSTERGELIWLFWSHSDSTWYADVVSGGSPVVGQLVLYTETDRVGTFAPVADVVGLQRIGVHSFTSQPVVYRFFEGAAAGDTGIYTVPNSRSALQTGE